METLKSINKDALQDFKLRVGIAVGPVIAGIVGASKPQYDIWVRLLAFASRPDNRVKNSTNSKSLPPNTHRATP